MTENRYTLRASTLAEVLVMMIVAGIVFLSVMDGLMLFNRLLLRQTEALSASGRTADGYYRTESLIAGADSLRLRDRGIMLFRNADSALLCIRDSVLVYCRGEFSDALLGQAGTLEFREGFTGQADTVEIGLHPPSGAFTIRFTAREPVAKAYSTDIGQTETGYGYEE